MNTRVIDPTKTLNITMLEELGNTYFRLPDNIAMSRSLCGRYMTGSKLARMARYLITLKRSANEDIYAAQNEFTMSRNKLMSPGQRNHHAVRGTILIEQAAERHHRADARLDAIMAAVMV